MDITYTNTITVDDYNTLCEAVGWGVRNPERVRAALTRTDFLIAAHIADQTIGMARVMHDGLQALIMDVVVLPEFQKQGIGKVLMRHIMVYLDDLSCKGGIFVNLMCAMGRENFYEKFGFEKRPNENRGPGMTLWLEKRN